MVAGIMAGVYRVFPFPVYVWQKACPHQQLPGNFGACDDCGNTSVGKSIEDLLGSAQLRKLNCQGMRKVYLWWPTSS